MTKPRSIDRAAVAAMIVLCASWGFQQVSVKLALPELPPIAQAAIRSIGAGVLVGLWAWRTHRDLRLDDGTLRPRHPGRADLRRRVHPALSCAGANRRGAGRDAALHGALRRRGRGALSAAAGGPDARPLGRNRNRLRRRRASAQPGWGDRRTKT